MVIVCVGLFGDAILDCFFTNNGFVEVKDDLGHLISPHPDWESDTYSEIIQAFSQTDDYVYLPRTVTGKVPLYLTKQCMPLYLA